MFRSQRLLSLDDRSANNLRVLARLTMHIMQKLVPFSLPASTNSSKACRNISHARTVRSRPAIFTSESFNGFDTYPGSVLIARYRLYPHATKLSRKAKFPHMCPGVPAGQSAKSPANDKVGLTSNQPRYPGVHDPDQGTNDDSCEVWGGVYSTVFWLMTEEDFHRNLSRVRAVRSRKTTYNLHGVEFCDG